MKTEILSALTDEQLVEHIRILDEKARSAQSQLAHARRALKHRRRFAGRLIKLTVGGVPMTGVITDLEGIQ